MDRMIRLVVVLPLFVLLIWCPRAPCPDNLEGNVETPGAKIVLTKFEVTDTSLDFSFQITNVSNHNIWICDWIGTKPTRPFEVYLAADEQTLVIRRRFDIATTWEFVEQPGCVYVRLAPGEDRTESLSLALPVEPYGVFVENEELGRGQRATRLVLEIGFYDRDLPTVIYAILAQAEKFTGEVISPHGYILQRYFPGLLIKKHFESFSLFNDTHQKEISNGWLGFGYMYEPRLGEQVLRLEVNGVHIPTKVANWLGPRVADDPACETVVAGDINGDCKVDLADFAIMALHWLDKG